MRRRRAVATEAKTASQVALDHRVEESDRFEEDSTTMRGRDPERGLALRFYRFRNSYVTGWVGRILKTTHWVREFRNLCVE